MSTTAMIIITVVATLGIAGIFTSLLKDRKAGQAIALWASVRPLLTEVFVEVAKIKEADKLGYDALENYAVNYVKGKIDASDLFTYEEKEILTADLIRSLISPKLEELYTKE